MEDSWENYMDEESRRLLKRYEEEMQADGLGFFDVDEYIVLIDSLMLRSQLSEAFQVARLARRQYPEASELKIKQAELSLETGFYNQAMALLQEVEAVEPYIFELYLVRGHALKLLSKYDEAEAAFQEAARKGADEIDVAMGMAEVKVARGDKQAAWPYMREMLGSAEDTVETCNRFIDMAVKAGLLEEAMGYVRELAKGEPYKILYWKLLAELAENAGAYGDALEAYEFALAVQPDDRESLFGKFRNLAYVDTRQSPLQFYLQMEKGMDDLADLIPLWCRIAQEYEIEEDWDKASLYYQRVADFPETRSYALFRLGVISNYRLDFPSALSFMTQALQDADAAVDAENTAKIYRGIARTYYYMGKAGENLRYNRIAVELQPVCRYHAYAYVLDACDLGEIPSAMAYVDSMLQSMPCHWLYLCKACLCYYGGRKADSYAFFAQAFGDRETRDDADVRIPGIYEEDSRVAELRNEYQPCFEDNDPEDGEPYIYYGPDEDYLQRIGIVPSGEDTAEEGGSHAEE